MSENNTPETQESVAQNISFGTFEWPYHMTLVELSRRVKDPTTGKGKAEKYKHPVVAPVITSSADAANFLSSLVMAADKKAPGAGVKLFNNLLGDRIIEASDTAFDEKTGEHDDTKIVNFTIAAERARSHGQKLEDINKAISELVPELLQLGKYASGDLWQTLINPVTNEQIFKTKDEYALRLVAVQSEVQKLLAAKEQKEQKQAEIKAKRDAKAAAGKEATLAKASPAPGGSSLVTPA